MASFNIVKFSPEGKANLSPASAEATTVTPVVSKNISFAPRFLLERFNSDRPPVAAGKSLLRTSYLRSTVISVAKVEPIFEVAPGGASGDALSSYLMYLCEYCDRPYHDLPKLKEHEQEHLAAGGFYSCCYCESNFISHEDIIEHRTSVCFFRGLWIDQVRKFIANIACTSCGFIFETADKLYEHRYNEYPHCAELVTLPGNELAVPVAVANPPEVTTDQQNAQPATMVDDFYFCHTCGKRYTYLSSYNRHVKSHEKTDGTLECPWLRCKFHFDDRQHFKNHIAKTHQRQVLYQCPNCNMYFLSQKVFRLHVANHRNYPKKTCSSCNKQFERLAMLRAHEKTHGGNSPLISGRKMDETLAGAGSPILSATEFKLPPIDILDDNSVVDAEEYKLCGSEVVDDNLADVAGATEDSSKTDTEADDDNIIVIDATTPPFSPDTYQKFIDSLYGE